MITKREIRDARIQLLVTPSKMKMMKALAAAACVSVNELINIAVDRLIDEETKHNTPSFRSIFDGIKAAQNDFPEHQICVEEYLKSQK